MAEHHKEVVAQMNIVAEEHNRTMNETLVKLRPKIHQFVNSEVDDIIKNNTVLVKFEKDTEALGAWCFTNTVLNIIVFCILISMNITTTSTTRWYTTTTVRQ